MAKPRKEISAIDLLEEGIHLLRQAPACLVAYYLGSIPFILCLLFFWADMSRNAYAASRCAAFSFLLTLLFLWMKCWHSVFARALWRRLGGQAPPWTPRRVGRLFATQTILQPWGVLLFLPALLLTIPFPWVYAYFQNVTVFGCDDREGLRAVHRRSRVQAGYWVSQNSAMIFDISFFGLIVFLNIAIALAGTPYLLKIFLGLESRFTQSPWAFVNTTFFATACALTFLCVDPLVKAVYVLRCFYGESLKTGESIWADLARLRRSAVLLLLALLCGLALPASASSSAPASPAVAPADLDRSIQDTLHAPRYTWRLPRELASPVPEDQKSFFSNFLDSVLKSIGDCIQTIGDWLDKMVKKTFGNPTPPNRKPSTSDDSAFAAGLFTLTKLLVYLLAAILLVALAILIWRIVKQNARRLAAPRTVPAATPPAPDLNDEQVVADQLPTDSWLLLAQQMIERGDLRLALRALYLACLAALADASLIRIKRSKSNLDYLRELMRRAHSQPGLLETFTGNVAAFDRAWYGLHEVTPQGLQDFQANYERIRALVG